jgi:hypothetical protein
VTYFDLAMTELWREPGGYAAMVDAGVDLVVAEAPDQASAGASGSRSSAEGSSSSGISRSSSAPAK